MVVQKERQMAAEMAALKVAAMVDHLVAPMAARTVVGMELL